MATNSRTQTSMTLEEFLKWSRIDEKPYLEYIDGRIEVKVSAQKKHSVIQKWLIKALDAFAEPLELGESFPELRCSFAGLSMVPDVVFQLRVNIQYDDFGDVLNETYVPPDIHIEIRSPDQSIKKTKLKLEHSLANGCPLGWYIDPERRTVDVYRPDRPPERLSPDGFLDVAPVLPGFRLAVREVFGWLQSRSQKPDHPEANPQ